jgi:photosystem II stability/assembly factor-like uncharacterized protein
MHRHHFSVIFLIMLLLSMLPSPVRGGTWIQVPLQEASQKMRGITGGEGLQYVYAITYAPSNPSVVYLSTDTSQVWKSQDGGSSWEPRHKGFLSHGARSLMVDPHNPDIVFAAGFLGFPPNEARQYGRRLQGIYRSINGGQSWDLVKNTDFFSQDSKGNLFAFDSSSLKGNATQVIYCGSYSDGLLCSRDGGTSWMPVGISTGHIIDLKEYPKSHGTLFIAAEDGLYRYHEGEKIEKIGKGLPDWPRSVAVCLHQPDVVYAAVGDYGIYRSPDGAEHFHPSNEGLVPRLHYTDVMVSPMDSNQVYVRAHLVGLPPFFSSDGGRHWQRPQTTNRDNILESEGFFFSSPFAPHPTDVKTALTVSNGKARVLKTTDGGMNWSYSGSGFTGGRMEDIAFADKDRMLFCLTDHGVWLSQDKGKTFRQLKTKRIFGLLSSSSGTVRGSTMVISVGSWHEKVLAVSHDSGGSWDYFEDLKDAYGYIAFHPKDDRVIYAGPYQSLDGGHSWRRLAQTVRAMFPGNGDIVYAASGTETKMCQILRSTDRGTSWNKDFPPCPFSLVALKALTISPVDQDRIYAATTFGIWIYNGKQWMLRNEKNGLSMDAGGMCYINCIAVDPAHPMCVYAGRRSPGFGQSNGVFRSLDTGQTWQNISANLGPELTIWSIKIDPSSSTVYIGTSLGTWRYQE